MTSFFSTAPASRQATHGVATFDIPALYFRDDAFGLFYTVDFERVQKLMPTRSLHPVRLPGNRAALGFVAFNYIDTSIGPYGEVAVVVPVVHGDKTPSALLPLLLESRYPGFGSLVLHLPVTTMTARDAGRGEWGYTKFTADMAFTITPEAMECVLEEGGHHILTLKVARKGIFIRDRKPLITYSVLNNDLIKTTIPQTGAFRMDLGPKQSSLQLGTHPVADSIRALGLAATPLISRCYVERNAILPSGEIVESGVASLDGYIGTDGDREHRVSYL